MIRFFVLTLLAVAAGTAASGVPPAKSPVPKAISATMPGDALGDAVNVKSYGAKGDGAADDTAAIQAACASGRNVLIPAGTYVVSRPISIDGRLQIDGPGATIVSIEPTGTVFTASGDLAGFVMRDVALRTRRNELKNRGGALFWADYHSIDGALFDNVTFDSGSSYSNGVLLAAEVGTTVKNVTFRNCTFTGASAGIEIVHHVDAVQRVTGLEILHNRFVHNGLKDDQYAGFAISLSGPLSHVQVIGNDIRGYPYAGIEVVAPRSGSFRADYVIQGNTVLGTGRGIITDSGQAGPSTRIFRVSISDNVVVGNRFFQVFQGLSDSVVEGNVFETTHAAASADHQHNFFAFLDCDRVLVANNAIRLELPADESGKALVALYGVKESHITGNRFESTGVHVLRIGSPEKPSADNSFSGNQLVHRDNGVFSDPVAFAGAGTTRNYLAGSTIVKRHESIFSSQAPGNVATGTVTIRSDTGAMNAAARSDFAGITGDLDLTKEVEIAANIVLRGSPAAGFTVTLPERDAAYAIANRSGRTATVRGPKGGAVALPVSEARTVQVSGGSASAF